MCSLYTTYIGAGTVPIYVVYIYIYTLVEHWLVIIHTDWFNIGWYFNILIIPTNGCTYKHNIILTNAQPMCV